MTTLVNATITTAAANVLSSVFQFRKRPRSLLAQFNFTYGSGGTTIDAYLQTSVDGGSTWQDIANFHGTTSSARKLVNLSSLTAVTTQVSGSDASLAANTAQDGIIGARWRVKYTSTGTYAGGTILAVDVQADETLVTSTLG